MFFREAGFKTPAFIIRFEIIYRCRGKISTKDKGCAVIGLGTAINVAGIICGGLAGYFIGDRLKSRMQDMILSMIGVGVMLLGISGALEHMLPIPGADQSGGTIMMILSLVVGSVIGEVLRIEDQFIRFGVWLKNKSNSENDSGFVDAFVTASLTVCVGAMAVIGSIKDGISGDYSILAAKGVIDAVFIFIMTASLGKGSIFSAIPVAVLQGSLTMIAFFAGEFMPAAALANLSFVGSVLIFIIGLNMIRDKKIRVANTLPAIVIAAVFGFFSVN